MQTVAISNQFDASASGTSRENAHLVLLLYILARQCYTCIRVATAYTYIKPAHRHDIANSIFWTHNADIDGLV